ncbi:hypothetical protein ACFCVY_02370 [Streptomyces sp. NPDC056411]|uniref:hypothetical protein n=1 Tax=Streptomyces sp. NPDC056411 TaxID=3345813 RepID=UPI0035DDB38A
MTEGCAAASVLGMLEEREAAARVRVEGLREEAARLAEVLEAAEIELDRRVVAREELVEGCVRRRGDCRDRSRSRALPRSRSWNSAISSCSRQRRKKA